MLFDKSKASYEELVKFLYTFHDPTTVNRQVHDTGVQYKSVIFFHSDEQKQIAERVTKELQEILDSQSANEQCFENKKVVTEVIKATLFFAADQEH